MKNSYTICAFILLGSPLIAMNISLSDVLGKPIQMGVIPTPSNLDEIWCEAVQNYQTRSVDLSNLHDVCFPTELDLKKQDFTKLSQDEESKLKSFFSSDRVLFLQSINIEQTVGVSQFLDILTDSDQLANLRTINVRDSDINIHDLYEFYRNFSLKKPFIRDIGVTSARSGQYVAQLSFRGYPKISYADSNTLGTPKDLDVPIYFRGERQFVEGVLKLQITD